MIPKTIHYCWFGRNKFPPLVEKCIESWKKYCPDYELICWNEDNFDINANKFVSEAYKAKQWAFVSDYVRLFAIYSYGGVYMDTDVELLKPIDCFLNEKAFSGFEMSQSPITGIIACTKGHLFIKMLLDDYDDRSFVLADGSYDMTPNTMTVSDICLRNGLLLNDRKQTIEGYTVYPTEYFCPKNFITGKLRITDNTYAIHHYTGSWGPKSKKIRECIRLFIYKIFGEELGKRIHAIKDVFARKD